MGKIIAKRLKGMNWKAKVSLVLIFTLVFSTFMYQGWYKPKQAQAVDTVIFVTSGTSWTVPSNWSSTNTIEVIGGGGGGDSAANTGSGGGGGGAYSKITNLSLTPSSSVTIQVGTGGAQDLDGTATWFNGATCAGASVCGDGGLQGLNAAGGTGGTTINSVGTTKFAGGAGGAGNTGGDTGGGGGGAGGPGGAGMNGGSGDATSASGGGGGCGGASSTVGSNASGGVGGAGGNGPAGTGGGTAGGGNATVATGGGGGGANTTPGGAGAQYNLWTQTSPVVTAGPGGGGGGAGNGGVGGAGGGYGAGGGGGEGTGGNGTNGIIVITYTPAPTVTSPTATSVASTTATLGANVTSDGGAALSANGICWALTANPAINCIDQGSHTTGVFTHARIGLTEGSLIYYRGYATNPAGTSYSADGTIYTEPTQPNTLSFTGVTSSELTVNWAIGSTGNADNVIVLMKQGAAVDAVLVDGTTYTANAAFGSGTQIGTGNYVVYQGTGTSVPVTALSGGITYYVKVYAFAAGAAGTENYNVTSPLAGSQATSLGMTLPPITSCAGCHGYSGYGFTDGTARNTPAGQVPGSHTKHVVTYSKVCSVCHVVPATETSVDFKHRNSNIQMKAGIEGGYYDKNNSSIYDAGDDTFAQTNTPSLQVCRTVYCHSQGTSNTSNVGTGADTRTTVAAPLANLTWGSAGACSSCHGNPPSYTNGATTWGAAKRNSHGATTHASLTCDKCHNQTTTTGNTITSPANHTNRLYNINPGSGVGLTYSYNVGGGSCSTISGPGGCHGNAQWGVTQIDCITCHTNALDAGDGAPTRRAIVPEFDVNWSHRRTGGPVTKYDCGVCHMEGNPTTGAVTAVHRNNVVDLRDPDTGATITNFSSATYTFATFASDPAAAKATAANTNNTDYIVAQRFCLKCHDSDGAFSSSARVTGGSATQPFGTTAGTRLDVDAQFATTNASAHPIKAPRQNSYCNSNNGTMVAPYGVAKTPGTPSNGVVIVCWDCHNIPTTAYTNRTIDAHGSGATASLLRGVYSATLTQSTFCNVCHNNYTSFANSAATYPHGTRGNMNNATISGYCQHCHSGTPTEARPERAKSVHGFNARSVAYPSAQRPFAFLRNTVVFVDWKPKQSLSAAANTSFGCSISSAGSSNGQSCTNNAMNTFYDGTFSASPTTIYGPGGVYPAY